MTITRLWDMAEGFGPIKNLLGAGDPNVHKIGGQWWMFLGAFQDTFKTNLFSASLPHGAPLSSSEWSFTTEESDPHRAASLVPQPGDGSWDAAGLHTPRYVQGIDASGRKVERIYYSGRTTEAVTGNSGSRYAIGMLERVDGAWIRRDDPVFVGTGDDPCALEPTVHYSDGKWRMWYNDAPNPGPGELPRYRINYVESRDGVTDWSAPVQFFSVADSYFDTSITDVGHGYEMVASRGGNHYLTTSFPEQGLWWYSSEAASGRRADWTADPVRILDSSGGAYWYANGVFGPCVRYGDTEADRNTMYVFFTGTYQPADPPFPAPFYFAVGRAEFGEPT
ncbi:hypothetical protein [Qaidamihabitans albus]|uniref:hypothetical protein n=1 Tax=Qaidamihabitans albus TaxID=2795733 RepID=UPI0018F1FCD1|nr:hypothetical protein [Qaidamihabitans albus]